MPILISVLILFGYLIVVIDQNFVLSLLPNFLRTRIQGHNTVVPEGNVNLYDAFIVNYFIGGFLSTLGLVLYLLQKKFKKKESLDLFFGWVIILLYTSFVLYITPIEAIRLIFYCFPGAEYMIKTQRLFYFIFICICIFSPVFWDKFRTFSSKITPKITPVAILSIVLLMSMLSAYSIMLPGTRDYNNNTLAGYEWVKDNVPTNSLILNDYYGQWLPLVANVRITLPFDPLFEQAELKSPYVLYQLYIHTNDTSAVNSTALLSEANFSGKVNYIFITTDILFDIQWKFGTVGLQNAVNKSIFDLGKFPNIVSVYKNSDVAIYKVLWD